MVYGKNERDNKEDVGKVCYVKLKGMSGAAARTGSLRHKEKEKLYRK